MRNVHLVVPELFLSKYFAVEACVNLQIPCTEKLLARGTSAQLKEPVTLESALTAFFGQLGTDSTPITAVSAVYDGLPQGDWLRADPVNLCLQRDQMLLSGVLPSAEESRQLCASLNEYFSGREMQFFAPHPQRWYLRLNALPRIRTIPLPELYGRNIRRALPEGEDAAHWHQLFNEIQMLLYAHPVNDAREARGELPINSLWFWGEGKWVESLRKNYQNVSSDDELTKMFSVTAGIPFAEWSPYWQASKVDQLLVWTGLRSALQRGDLAAWRDFLQDFEIGYAQPLWQALQNGKIRQIKIDVLAGRNSRRFKVTRGETWAFWRRSKPLTHYSTV